MVLIDNDLAITILLELSDVVCNRKQSLLGKLLQLRHFVQHICNQVRTELLHAVPHVINVGVTNQEHVDILPGTEPVMLATIPTIIIIDTDHITRVVGRCYVWVLQILLMR